MALTIDDDRRRIEASVGDLLPTEEGDPFAGRTSFARLLAGTRAHVAHAKARSERDASYRSEVVVRGEVDVAGWTLALQGRVDGLHQQATPSGASVVVEEVKTVVLGDDAFAVLKADHYPSYMLQLQLYLYLLVTRENDPPASVAGQLVFINLPGNAHKEIEVPFDRELVHAVIVGRVEQILAERVEAREWGERRRAIASKLEFPFAELRPHQAEMEKECGRAFDDGECLLVSAPPGLGKTAAALTAALRHALGHERRVFFLTSKTTQQRIVQTTLGLLTEQNPGVTAVVLRAKAKICANEVVFCHGDFCEFARDYPSKVALGRSRERLLGAGLALPDEVYAEGVRVRACPFEMSLDLTMSADVVVGDYNYVFDPSVAVQRAFDDRPFGDLVLVIDEAHNLLDRAREYYSPSFDTVRVRELLELVQLRPGDIYRAIEAWAESLLVWFADVADSLVGELPLSNPTDAGPQYAVERAWDVLRKTQAELEDLLLEYLAFRRECGDVQPDDPVLDVAYAFLRFARVLALDGDEFVYLFEPQIDGDATYRIVCLDPSRQLKQRIEGFHAVVAMSATLEPESYYRDLLGFPAERTSSVEYPSPFAQHNRRILVVPTVATTYRERSRWYDQVAATLREVYATHAGHWVAFFPSFAYLREIELRIGDVEGELLVQQASMYDADRADILERLERPDGTPRLLLGVLGGVFAEGVDLPGESLVGVVIVSPGLPRVSVTRELIRRRFDELAERGFEYAYLIPGINRVIQAAGRLLRSESDRGVVVLLDRRFATDTYTRLFPRDWYRESPRELVTRDPAAEVEQFFGDPRSSAE